MRQNLQSVSIIVIVGLENILIRLVNKDFIKIVICQIARGTGEWTLQMDWINWISKTVKGLSSIGIGPTATTTFIILWDFLMFYQIFLLPQVKRCAIITHKHGKYELPYELPNNLRLSKLGKVRKMSKSNRMIA